MTTATVILIGFVAGLLGAVVGDLISEEVRGRLDRVPEVLIRFAGRHLPNDVEDEVTAARLTELQVIMRGPGADRLPLTRLILGLRFAAAGLPVITTGSAWLVRQRQLLVAKIQRRLSVPSTRVALVLSGLVNLVIGTGIADAQASTGLGQSTSNVVIGVSTLAGSIMSAGAWLLSVWRHRQARRRRRVEGC